jgi:hypothetical protein
VQALQLQLIRLYRATPAQMVGMRDSDLRATRAGWEVRCGDITFPVAREQLDGYEDPFATLASLPATGAPLQPYSQAWELRHSMRPLTRRAGLGTLVGHCDLWAPDLTDAEWQWVAPFVREHHLRNLRDRAYILGGVATAARHANLADVQLSDVTADQWGYEIQFRRTKTRVDGQLVRVDHATPEAPGCPACALAGWLAAAAVLGHSTGALFPSIRRGKIRPERFSVVAGTEAIRRACRTVGHVQASTRCLRRGGATTVAETTGDLGAVKQLTDHKTGAVALRYIDLSAQVIAPARVA